MHGLVRKKYEVILLFIVTAFPFCRTMGQANPQMAPPSKSDTFAEDESGHKFRVQHGELAKENFQIAGLDLTLYGEILDQAFRVLGKTPTIATGDASTADERACYMPEDLSDNTRLYVHRGEVDSEFVLSSGVPASERKLPCLRTSKVSRLIATGAGLRLGQTPEQVIAIIGLPTRRIRNARDGSEFMEYSFESARKKLTQREIERIRRANPQFYDTDPYYVLEELIRVKFKSSAVSELDVDWSAQD
jgi:hypothetical protein